MKKLKTLSIVSLVGNAVILAICLFMIFGLKLLVKDTEGWDSLGAALVTVIFFLPGSIICGVLTVVPMIFKSLFLAKGKKKLNIFCLPLDILIFLVSTFLALLIFDEPTAFEIIIFVAVVLLAVLALLVTVLDICNIVLSKNKEEISNE